MSCDCGCTNTTVNCNCPDPDGIISAKLDNIVSATFGSGEDISAGYTYNLYTNSTTNTQYVYIQTNAQIICTGTHNIQSEYFNNAVSTGLLQYDDNASTRADYTHFLIRTNILAGKTISIKFTSSDVNGKLKWLQAFIYKQNI